jgi:sporulation protein YlmC with PRC-barrel domain
VGKRVIGANAYMLGEVTGADVDTEKWQITHLHVSLTDEATRELGFKAVSWPRYRVLAHRHNTGNWRCNIAQQIHR